MILIKTTRGYSAEAGDSWITGQSVFSLTKNKPGDWVADQSIQLSPFFFFCLFSVPQHSRGDWKKSSSDPLLFQIAEITFLIKQIKPQECYFSAEADTGQNEFLLGSLQQNGGQSRRKVIKVQSPKMLNIHVLFNTISV